MDKKIFSDFEGEIGSVEDPALEAEDVTFLPPIDKNTAEKLITEIQSLRKELEEFKHVTDAKKS